MDQYTELLSLIAAMRQRWLRLVVLRTAGRATAAAAAPVLGALAVGYALAPEGLALVLLVVATVACALALAGIVLWRMPRRPDDRHVARFVEERAGALPGGVPLDDALVSAVEIVLVESPDSGSRAPFSPLIVAAAVRRLRAIAPVDVIDRPAIRRAAAEALGGTALLFVAVGVSAPASSRAVESARVRFFPQSIVVDVTPGDARVPAGTRLRIAAALRNGTGTLASVAPSLVVEAGGARRTVPMVPAGGGFEYTFESVDRTFHYSVAVGAVRSPQFTVTTLFPPRVRSIDLQYVFPPFTGLPSRDERDGGDIYGPAGTRVRLRVHTDKPVTAGAIALGGSPAIALRNGGDRLLEGEVVLRADDSYRVTLADGDGLRSIGESEYFIRVMDDRPPDVRVLRPSGDEQITPLEEVSIEARADDDYGIATFDLVYAVAGQPERTVPFDRVTGTNVQKVGGRLLRAEELGVKPGDVITYYARARDVARGKRSSETRSDIFFLEVTPFNEEFVAAMSQAMAGGAGAQIDSLIEAQKQIISATWNIERRSQSGRSAEDMKAIAQAQTEIRARAEQMGSRSFRGGGGIPPAQRPAPDSPQTPRRPAAAADPIAAAIEAMAKAVRQLQDQKTKEAIPHEMSALNGLLQAQAEVRRRQVSQQANGGGNANGNRQGQDLSALFDKELQRQQRTNYESRSQIEERPDQRESGDTTLDRVRDLARRQEELSRRQRDLATAGLNPEELKRQLEKLTREQTELRQQAEELARQMSQKPQREPEGQRPQPSESSGGQSQASGGMKDASEQMRSAASDLRREDPDAAARNGDRAVQQLRRIEQAMSGDTAKARQRAAGDLRLEAQQIAQEQRRIAAEADRLSSAQGSGAAEAARRLAAEKERLAGRVDGLQRSATQLAKDRSTETDAAALNDAARDLERERIGQRMRETARRMRDAGQAGTGADGQAEKHIARLLDHVVDTLGGTASAEARGLSEQLDQTREMRDRLNRLEQQVRDAETRERGDGIGSPQRSSRSPADREAQQGREGPPGAGGGGGRGRQGGSELERLRQEYQRELARAREALGRLSEGGPPRGTGRSTPEQQEFSHSAPGTERFKQDRSGWESLRKDLDQALEKYEATVSERVLRNLTGDRFSAGGSERVPDSYRQQIARYYRSLANGK